MEPTPALLKRLEYASPETECPAQFAPAHRIEVVIPFTSMRQAQAGLRDAEQLCSGLDVCVRVVRVVIVPFPLDLDHPPAPVSSIVDEMLALRCDLPLALDILVSRDGMPALMAALSSRALVLLTTRARLWRTMCWSGLDTT